jgi:hypothetical protein
MIATAIGKPTASVLINVRANSESSVGSARICSDDMRLAPSLKIENRCQKKDGFSDVRAKAASARLQTATQWLTIG